MSNNEHKHLDEGGPKERHSGIDGEGGSSSLKEENRQALKNQGNAKPKDYPDRDVKPA